MNNLTLFNKDCRHMDELADNSIQCCVTSPPYWGLRKYKAPDITFSGDDNCHHEWIAKIDTITGGHGGGVNTSTIMSPAVAHNRKIDTGSGEIQTNTCAICGAWRGQFGLEPTVELYVAHTIEILREIKRVLRPDGVVFWNIGDSYFASGSKQTGCNDTDTKGRDGGEKYNFNTGSDVLKPKDLCLIPFRVAIAAQEDGWWVRSDIIWNKPNPMPESVTDRPTDAYEHIFMFTKSARYYWDAEAVREPYIRLWGENNGGTLAPDSEYTLDAEIPTAHTRQDNPCLPNPTGRNLRNVWTFPTQPYKEAHFATFPEALPEKCIKAASKEGDIVLDPFAGSGTTLYVARKLGRKAVGYEISPQYCKLIEKRNAQAVMA